MSNEPAKRWQFSLHGVFVATTLLAVGLAIASQWGGPLFAGVMMVFLAPLFVAIYITVASTAEWISERIAGFRRERLPPSESCKL